MSEIKKYTSPEKRILSEPADRQTWRVLVAESRPAVLMNGSELVTAVRVLVCPQNLKLSVRSTVLFVCESCGDHKVFGGVIM